MSEKKIDFDSLISFVRTNGLKVLVRGVLSLCVAVLLLVLYFAFAPRSERYAVEVQVTLESRNGVLYYPNGDRFGAHDIISAPVLDIVWKKYGLDAKKVKFEDFCQWFGVVGYDTERAKVDAEFQGKMSKRNITVIELTAVQKEYEDRLAALSCNRFLLSMAPKVMIDHETAAKMMNDIPEIWFGEYSRLKAPLIPSVAAGESVKSYLVHVQTDGSRVLELLDVLRSYLSGLFKTGDYIRNGLMKGRNAVVDGVDIGVYESQLAIFQAELMQMKYMILNNVDLREVEDYINARLEDMDCEQKLVEERLSAVSQALDSFGAEGVRAVGGQNAVGAKPGVSANANPVSIQVDSGFFSDFVALVRRNINIDFVIRYTDELAAYRKQLAEIASRRLYYDQIMKHQSAFTSNKADHRERSSKFLNELIALANNMLQTGDKIIAFRNRCYSIYRTSNQFYVIAAPVSYGKSFVLTPHCFVIGLLAVLALFNLWFLVCDWRT